MLTIEENKRFDELEETFATAGWQRIVKDALQEIEALRAEALEVGTWEEVVHRRGQAVQLAILTRLPEITEYEKQQLTAQRSDEEEYYDADV